MIAIYILLLSICPMQTPSNQTAPQPDVRCGSYCLYAALQTFQKAPETFTDFESGLDLPGPNGYSILQLQRAAETHQAKTLAVETSIENLLTRKKPFACLTLIDDSHFVLLYDIDATKAYIIDSPRAYTVNLDLFRSRWSRKALLISDSPLETEESLNRKRLMGWINIVVLLALTMGIVMLCILRFRSRRSGSISRLTMLLLCVCFLTGCNKNPTNDLVSNVPDPEPGISAWLSIDSKVIDLGVIIRKLGDQEIPFQFNLSNKGFRPINFQSLQIGCSCTSAKIGCSRLNPGESTNISGRVRVSEFSTSNSSRITVGSDDPISPLIELSIIWEVSNILRTSPPKLEIGNLPPDQPSSKSELPVVLENLNFCESCKVLIEPSSPCVLTDFKLLLDRDENHNDLKSNNRVRNLGVLGVSVIAQDEERYCSESIGITVTCQGNDLVRYRLPISWNIASPIALHPSHIFTGQLTPRTLFQHSVTLQSRTGVRFRVTSVEGDPEIQKSISSIPTSADQFHRLDFEFLSPIKPGPWRYIVRLKTDYPGLEEIRIPVSGIVHISGP